MISRDMNNASTIEVCPTTPDQSYVIIITPCFHPKYSPAPASPSCSSLTFVAASYHHGKQHSKIRAQRTTFTIHTLSNPKTPPARYHLSTATTCQIQSKATRAPAEEKTSTRRSPTLAPSSTASASPDTRSRMYAIPSRT